MVQAFLQLFTAHRDVAETSAIKKKINGKRVFVWEEWVLEQV